MNESVWNLIIDDPLPGPLNMAIDEVLLHRSDSTPVLRLYRWSTPTLSLGLAQKISRHVNFDVCRKNSIPVVRRITGGKAVLHDRELTYSLCGSVDMPPFCYSLLDTYCEIGHAFCKALKLLNIDAELASRRLQQPQSALSSCFANASSYEILVSGKKLLGSAQKRTRNRVLQHGSLLMKYDPRAWKMILIRQNAVLEDRVTDMETETGKEVSIALLNQAISRGFSEHFGISFRLTRLLESELVQAYDLAENKYFDLVDSLDSKVNQSI